MKAQPGFEARKPVLVLLLATVLGACGDAGDATVAVQDSAGIRVVTNDPRTPAWSRADSWRVGAQPEIQVGNNPGAPGHDLYGVEHARRLADGRIVVANGGFGDIRVFDSSGLFLVRLPSSHAPFPISSRPTRVFELPGDTLVASLADGRMALFELSGALIQTFTPSAPDAGSLKAAGRFRDGTLLFESPLPFDSSGTGIRRHQVMLERYTPSGQRVDGYGAVDDRAELLGEGLLVFAPEGVYAAADSTVWYGDQARFEIREIASGGRVLKVVRLGNTLDSVTGADTSTYKANALAQLRRSAEAGDTSESAAAPEAEVARYSYPKTFPSYSQIVVDDLGNVWVRHYQWYDLGSEKRWSVFGPDGTYLGDVLTPNLLEVYQIGADFILGRMATSRGREAVYLYTLEKPL